MGITTFQSYAFAGYELPQHTKDAGPSIDGRKILERNGIGTRSFTLHVFEHLDSPLRYPFNQYKRVPMAR